MSEFDCNLRPGSPLRKSSAIYESLRLVCWFSPFPTPSSSKVIQSFRSCGRFVFGLAKPIRHPYTWPAQLSLLLLTIFVFPYSFSISRFVPMSYSPWSSILLRIFRSNVAGLFSSDFVNIKSFWKGNRRTCKSYLLKYNVFWVQIQIFRNVFRIRIWVVH